MEYYSALKMKEILSHAIAWINLEAIMLSDISQSQKDQILDDLTYMSYLK